MQPDPLLEALLQKDAWLRRRAARIARDPQSADDLVQEAWVAALQRRPDPAHPLEPWLEGVLRNVRVRWRRERLRSAALALEAEGIERAAPEHALFDRERRERLLAAIGQLAEPYRSTVRQRFLEERTVGEIAHLAAEPRATVSTRLRRGLESLRRSLEPRQRWLPALGLLRRGRSGAEAQAPAAPAMHAARAWLGWTAACGALLVALGAGDLPGAEAPRDPSVLARSSGLGAHAAEDGTGPRAARGLSAVQGRALVEPVGADFETAAASSAPPSARGRVVWESSGAPAAGVPARVVLENGESIECTTDADGCFELPAERAARALGVVFPSAEPSAAPPPSVFLARGAFAEPVELILGRGPVVRLALEAPPPAEARDLTVLLRSVEPAIAGVPGARLGPGLAAGELAAQLPELGFSMDLARSGSLCIATADGFWAADARLDAAALAGQRAIPLHWSLRGALELTVLDPAGQPAAGGIVAVSPRGARSGWGLAPDAAGRVRMAALAPGEYEVRVETPVFSPWSGALRIEPGLCAELAAELEIAGARGFVRGEITSETGAYDKLVLLVLSGGGQEPQYQMAQWSPSERGTLAPFAFECLSDRSFELAVVPLADHRAFAPAAALAVRAGDEVALVCRDAAPCADLDLRVRPPEGTEPAPYELEVRFRGGPSYALQSVPGGVRWGLVCHGLRWLERSGPALPGVPLDADFEWTLRAAGQPLQSGDRSAFALGTAELAVAQSAAAEVPAATLPEPPARAPLDAEHGSLRGAGQLSSAHGGR